jgi:hypothetical protein
VFYTVIDRELFHDVNAPGRVVATEYQDVLFLFMNDDEANIAHRKEGIPLQRTAVAKDALGFEFKADGTYKCKVYMKELYSRGVFNPMFIWQASPSVIAMPGGPSFASDKTFPVCIQFSSGARR